MRIPEQHLCDVVDCIEPAKFNLIHHIITTSYRSQQAISFEFCEDHASGFTMTGRGAWSSNLKLKPNVPAAVLP